MSIEATGRRSPAQHGPPPAKYAPPLISWEDFHNAYDEERPTEWVDGEIIEIMPPSIRHQLVVLLLLDLVRHHVVPRKLGLVVQDILMRLARRPSGRAPDILFLSAEHKARDRGTYIDGAVDLAIEVVSPDSEVRDRREKLLEYEAAGVAEYWLVDDLRHEAYFFVLGEGGRYQAASVGEDGIYSSTVLPGLKLKVDWLWRDPLPTLDEALAELG
jgi:Uma2 family endonuclease